MAPLKHNLLEIIDLHNGMILLVRAGQRTTLHKGVKLFHSRAEANDDSNRLKRIISTCYTLGLLHLLVAIVDFGGVILQIG